MKKVAKCPDGIPTITMDDYLYDYEFRDVYIETIPNIATNDRFRRFMYSQFTSNCTTYFTHGVPVNVTYDDAPMIRREGWTIAADTGPQENHDDIMRKMSVDPYDVCHMLPYFKISASEFLNKCKCRCNKIHCNGPNPLAHYLLDEEYMGHDNYTVFTRPEFMLDIDISKLHMGYAHAARDKENLHILRTVFAYMMREKIHIYLMSSSKLMKDIDKMLDDIYDNRHIYEFNKQWYFYKFYSKCVIDKIMKLQ